MLAVQGLQDVGSKSDLLRRIVHIAQKEIFLNFALFRNALLSADEMRECVEAFVKEMEWTDCPDYEELIRLGEKAAKSGVLCTNRPKD